MLKGVKLINSGFQFIDKKWGGFYTGGSYLLIGPKKSGRTLLALQIAAEAVQASEVVLFFTTMRPKDLMIQASSINFDIQSYMDRNLIIVVKVALPNDAYNSSNQDDIFKEYLNDIISVTNQYKPKRFIFDEITPYIDFKNLDYLHNSFLSTIETIEDKDITSLFVVGEPADERSENIINVLSQCVTGKIMLDTNIARKNPKSKGLLKITPNVGHTQGEFSEEYFIEAYKGLVTISDSKTDDTKKSIKDSPSQSDDSIVLSNEYNYPDFMLLLNNQIAMFKSTGQKFNLVSIILDPVAQISGIITVNQLRNSISAIIEKKNKMCVLENRIFILFGRSAEEKIKKTISEIKNNLPEKDSDYLEIISKYISVVNLEISEQTENAEQLIASISSLPGKII